jgi:thiol-disulfide isomerase/thioredoxin
VLLFSTIGWAAEIDVQVVGVSPGSSADLAISGGAPITVEIGQTVEGVTVLRADRHGAVVRVGAITKTLPLVAYRGSSRARARQQDLAELARCIAGSGAVFYGAHWCPICKMQKEYFDGYAHLLPYVECYDGPKANGMNARCKKVGIEKFPTWVLPDGSVKSGALQPRSLAADTGCRER